jgi:hypothetical protein
VRVIQQGRRHGLPCSSCGTLPRKGLRAGLESFARPLELVMVCADEAGVKVRYELRVLFRWYTMLHKALLQQWQASTNVEA